MARPWFEEDDWIPALDRYLSARSGVWPSILRIQEIDEIADPEAIVGLAERSRDDDDPARPFLDQAHFTALARSESRAAAMSDLTNRGGGGRQIVAIERQ